MREILKKFFDTESGVAQPLKGKDFYYEFLRVFMEDESKLGSQFQIDHFELPPWTILNFWILDMHLALNRREEQKVQQNIKKRKDSLIRLTRHVYSYFEKQGIPELALYYILMVPDTLFQSEHKKQMLQNIICRHKVFPICPL
jgi:hypothetical protein